MRFTRHLFGGFSQVIAFRDFVKNTIGCRQRLVFVPYDPILSVVIADADCEPDHGDPADHVYKADHRAASRVFPDLTAAAARAYVINGGQACPFCDGNIWRR